MARLGLDVPRVPLQVDVCTPAVGQGALGIEVRDDHPQAAEAARTLQDEPTAVAVIAERSLGNGGKTLPGAEIVIQVIRTQADEAANIPFDQLPGKGFFVKEIEGKRFATSVCTSAWKMWTS